MLTRRASSQVTLLVHCYTARPRPLHLYATYHNVVGCPIIRQASCLKKTTQLRLCSAKQMNMPAYDLLRAPHVLLARKELVKLRERRPTGTPATYSIHSTSRQPAIQRAPTDTLSLAAPGGEQRLLRLGAKDNDTVHAHPLLKKNAAIWQGAQRLNVCCTNSR